MNDLSNLKLLLTRIFGVVLVAAVCILFGTAVPTMQKPAASSPPPSMEETPSPTETVEPSPEPTPEYFELSFTGDSTLASSVYNKTLSNSYENTVGDNYAYPFELTADFFRDDDFTFTNLECVFTASSTATAKNFVFGADPAYVNILKEGGVEFVTLGNNHVLDYGEAGYAETKAVLDEAGISYAGRDEWSIYETQSGLKIGVYALSFGTSQQIRDGIAAVRNAGAEFVVAALHWGDEGSYRVNDLQKQLAHTAVEAGADFVYGSHPHTLQPIEEYNGVYIYYSMGNWSFGGNTAPRDPDTFILKITVMRDVDGSISITDRKHIPCACTGVKGGNDYRPVPYEEGGEAWLRTLSKLDGSFTGADLSIGYDYGFGEY